MKINRHRVFIKEFNKAKLSDSQFEKFVYYVNCLRINDKLPFEARDHSLNGEYLDCREFHIGGDMLVIYLLNEDSEVVLLRIGTHSQLFKKY